MTDPKILGDRVSLKVEGSRDEIKAKISYMYENLSEVESATIRIVESWVSAANGSPESLFASIHELTRDKANFLMLTGGFQQTATLGYC